MQLMHLHARIRPDLARGRFGITQVSSGTLVATQSSDRILAFKTKLRLIHVSAIHSYYILNSGVHMHSPNSVMRDYT